MELLFIKVCVIYILWVYGKLANISVIYLGTATVTVNSDSKATLTHNLNITGNYFIQVICTSNLNIVFSYALNKNNLGLIFYDTGMLPIGSGTRTVSYIIITWFIALSILPYSIVQTNPYSWFIIIWKNYSESVSIIYFLGNDSAIIIPIAIRFKINYTYTWWNLSVICI